MDPSPNTLDSGKTSLIHSLAGELGLDIYVVSLSSKGYVITRPGLLVSSFLTKHGYPQHE